MVAKMLSQLLICKEQELHSASLFADGQKLLVMSNAPGAVPGSVRYQSLRFSCKVGTVTNWSIDHPSHDEHNMLSTHTTEIMCKQANVLVAAIC